MTDGYGAEPDADNAGPPETGPPVQQSTLHYILFGSEGLRAGWGIILFYAMVQAILRCLRPLRQGLLHAPTNTGNVLSARQTVSFEGAGVIAVMAAMWLMARLERRRVAAYGLAARHRARYLLGGLMWGLAMLSLLVFLLRVCRLLQFDARLLTGAGIARYALMWLGAFVLVAVKEELLFRGYLQFTLTRGLRSVYHSVFGSRHANALGFWTAATALSYYFGAGHSTNQGESPIGLFSAALAGLLFCLSLWRTGSLWWAIGFHTTWDWAQSFLYGVPDSGLVVRGHLFATSVVGRPWVSGGVTGPEGSVLFLPVVLAAAGVVLLTLPRTHHGYLPVHEEWPPREETAFLP